MCKHFAVESLSRCLFFSLISSIVFLFAQIENKRLGKFRYNFLQLIVYCIYLWFQKQNEFVENVKRSRDGKKAAGTQLKHDKRAKSRSVCGISRKPSAFNPGGRWPYSGAHSHLSCLHGNVFCPHICNRSSQNKRISNIEHMCYVHNNVHIFKLMPPL